MTISYRISSPPCMLNGSLTMQTIFSGVSSIFSQSACLFLSYKTVINEKRRVYNRSYIKVKSYFQLYMVRTMLESLIDDKNVGRRPLKRELNPRDLSAIEHFHRYSFYWSYLLNLNGNVVEITLSHHVTFSPSNYNTITITVIISYMLNKCNIT